MVYAKECTAREFLRLSEKRRLFAPQKQFTPDKTACDRAKNPLLERRHVFLAGYEDGAPKARLFLVDGGDAAWFSMPVLPGGECTCALVDKAVEIARKWGCEELRGPVSPDGSGFGIGTPLPASRAEETMNCIGVGRSAGTPLSECGDVAGGEAAKNGESGKSLPVSGGETGGEAPQAGESSAPLPASCGGIECNAAQTGMGTPGSRSNSAPWHPEGDGRLAQVLAQNGFEPCMHLLELTIPLHNRRNPYRGAGERALSRRGMRIEALPPNRRACEAAFAVSQDAHARGYAAFERVFARCAQLAPGMRAIVAFVGNAPAGWILFVPEKGRTVRLLHMQILPQFRRGVCAAALLEMAWDMAAERGAREIYASTIDPENAPSIAMARNAGAALAADYAVFCRKTHPKASNNEKLT